MRRHRVVAATIGVGALGCASIGAALFVITRAIADPGSAESDEVIRTAPESFPDLAALSAAPAAPTTPTAKAETAAAQTPVPPLPLEAAEASARAMRQWAGPRLAEARDFAVRYEPAIDVRTTQTPEGHTQTKIAFALGTNPFAGPQSGSSSASAINPTRGPPTGTGAAGSCTPRPTTMRSAST